VSGQCNDPAALPPEKRADARCMEGWMDPPDPVRTGAEYLALNGIRSRTVLHVARLKLLLY